MQTPYFPAAVATALAGELNKSLQNRNKAARFEQPLIQNQQRSRLSQLCRATVTRAAMCTVNEMTRFSGLNLSTVGLVTAAND